MLCDKIVEKDIDLEDIWKDDVLNRQQVAIDFYNIIKGIDKNFVISINAEYGMGKTFFLKRWAKEIENDNNKVIYFDAWNYDFQKEPLIPFLSTIVKNFTEEKSLKLLSNKIIKSAKLLTNLIIQYIGGPSDITNKIDEYIKNDNIIDDYEEIDELITKYKKTIKDLVKNKKLYIIIDELERCRPTYAIELLEAIKHIFDIDNIIFILGISREQLKHTVSQMYGLNMDGDGYLKRFIDIELQLPEPDRKSFCNMLTNHFNINDTNDSIINGWKCFFNYFSELSDCYKLSLRDIIHCFSEINILHNILPERKFTLMPILAWLVILRNKKTDIYNNIENMSFEELWNEYTSTMSQKSNHYDEMQRFIKAITLTDLRNKHYNLEQEKDNLYRERGQTNNSREERIMELNNELEEMTRVISTQDLIQRYNLEPNEVLHLLKKKMLYLSSD